MRGFKVELSDGSSFTEENIESALAHFIKMYGWSTRPWIILRNYIKLRNLKIISLQLVFDNQGVFLPRCAKVYFYSKKVESFMGGTGSETLYYGVGATESKDDQVVITWFDGFGSKMETRKIEPEKEAFIVN